MVIIALIINLFHNLKRGHVGTDVDTPAYLSSTTIIVVVPTGIRILEDYLQFMGDN